MINILIIYNKDKKNAVSFYKKSKEYLIKKGANIVKIEESKKADFMIILGGDGTLLAGCKAVLKEEIPILGINLGSLGFLTEITTDEAFSVYDDILNNNYSVEKRSILEVFFNNITKYAVNDIVLSKGGLLSRMIRVDLFENEHFINRYRADGIIVSTSTGSTAYSLSAGGPIVMPNIDALVVTPIAPHTLSARPIVLDGTRTIRMTPVDEKRDVHLTIDGEEIAPIECNDFVLVKTSEIRLNLIKSRSRDYYSVLREKLKWGNGIC